MALGLYTLPKLLPRPPFAHPLYVVLLLASTLWTGPQNQNSISQTAKKRFPQCFLTVNSMARRRCSAGAGRSAPALVIQWRTNSGRDCLPILCVPPPLYAPPAFPPSMTRRRCLAGAGRSIYAGPCFWRATSSRFAFSTSPSPPSTAWASVTQPRSTLTSSRATGG